MSQPKTHTDLLKKLVDIARGYGWTVEDIAEELGVSRGRFYQMIHSNYVPPWYWINIQRLSEKQIRANDFLYTKYDIPKNSMRVE